MKKLLAYTTAIVLFVAAGCDGGESRMIATSSTNSDRVVIPLLADIAGTAVENSQPMILSSVDGSVQEEVVYFDTPLAASEEAEVIEVPEIIATALGEAPAIDAAGEAFEQRQLILKNEDGTVQEEVVFTDSDDELGSVEEVEELPLPPTPSEVGVATLQVPVAR